MSERDMGTSGQANSRQGVKHACHLGSAKHRWGGTAWEGT